MTISPEVMQAAAKVCQEAGQEPTQAVLNFAECLLRLMRKMEANGRQHAQEARRPVDRAQLEDLFPFIEWEELRSECITLLHDAYITGYIA